MSKQNIKLSEPINKTMYRIVYRQFSTVLLRMWRHKMFFFVGFFIYFHKYIAAFELFTPFIMRCEANFKVKTNPKPCALAFSYGATKGNSQKVLPEIWFGIAEQVSPLW